uniref:Uncharacterized protein n=1 Tax=Grammatophora oceanica TaxID=210454 RepID=A0A7S1VM81_9STRA|mmetsp:Transcript_50427/g.75365  ORF Transcript_50427/g.75365 Transcript_50427/m.75365 type:complete len:1184 (+) Transcript_50427:341-3892(+)|eukprot:CAMPEP_0194034924 /NCGR_PEP_ID=MMETSP0009_2-20130614/7376_1 /TAXON_ID=210454 /ORGANISM="Grammatophora oceanica, Strain CCMP 410" /LENGTH=1183 /DNA_ID=CAMNT_0038676075 /DNA_START=300 /DNA_END=3851 /DNA_ORIENTATION=-
MDPALDILNHALAGEPGALAFLERTSSLYILDATVPLKPKTYGGWNFIHQALNEVERQESSPHVSASSPQLNGHVQLLATLAKRVARRSPVADRQLVTTCIENASSLPIDGSAAQSLLELNAEIREIVMGRIAALAFDFSFHKNNSKPTPIERNPSNGGVSAFSDPVAIEYMCAVLSANAVSTGPKAVQHFLMTWIVPSVNTLPPFSVACVTLHIAVESLRKGAPVGTKDMLQRLSRHVVGIALIPVLEASMAEEGEAGGAPGNNDGLNRTAWKNRVASMALRGLERWCKATDLSLPQVKHICSKLQTNYVGVISDAMYSDSPLVIDAMAELLELALTATPSEQRASKDRMTQARYIMEVDEESFRQISPEDLFRIESKETDVILGELVSAVGLQRFRFVERQNLGDLEVCRNLTRIAASVGSAALNGLMSGVIQGGGAGLLDLLMKAAGHPSVNVCAIALEVLALLVPLDPNFPVRLLPTLQHRAIVPHTLENSIPSIVASSVCGVDFHEFESFREKVLTDALIACYRQNPAFYMDSCTSAIEEFCSADATVAVSFQLEAALYCLSSIALVTNRASTTTPELRHDSQLGRCTAALAKKPIFITANPLTLAQLNRFIGKFGPWFAGRYVDGVLDIAAELSLSTFSIAESAFSEEEPARLILQEMPVSPFSEAANAMRILLTRQPSHFISQQAMAALGGGWEASYKACNRPGTLTLEDRLNFCTGMCHVFAALPTPEHRAKPYRAFALPTLQCLRAMLTTATSNGVTNGHLAPYLARIAGEIKILATMISNFHAASSTGKNPSIELLREAWPSLLIGAEAFSGDREVSEALSTLLIACIPERMETAEDIGVLREVSTLASIIVNTSSGNQDEALSAVLDVISQVIAVHGASIDNAINTILDNNGVSQSSISEDAGRCIESLLLKTIGATKDKLGAAWTRPKEQGQGQTAVESKSRGSSGELSLQDQKPTSTSALSSIFNVLETIARCCPAFLTHLPAASGKDQETDRLLHRAMESAISSVTETDVDLVRNALLFLKSTVEVLGREDENMRLVVKQIIESSFQPSRRSLSALLLEGACGGFHPTSLDPAASLLYVTLRSCNNPEDAKACIEAALNQDCFRLGDGEEAKRSVALYMERGAARGELPVAKLMELFDDIWALHQTEGQESVSNSDVAASFARKYAPSP